MVKNSNSGNIIINTSGGNFTGVAGHGNIVQGNITLNQVNEATDTIDHIPSRPVISSELSKRLQKQIGNECVVLPVDIYNATVRVWDTTPERMVHHYKASSYGKSGGFVPSFQNCAGMCIHEPSFYTMIFINNRFTGVERTSTFVHEFIHAAVHILERVGLKIEHDNHEALTYLVDLLVRQAGEAELI